VGKWPAEHGNTEKPGHRIAMEKVLFLRPWGVFIVKPEVIGDMSVNTVNATVM
jgi:hypothetical protein